MSDEPTGKWLFNIATPLVDQKGLQKAYQKVREIREKNNLLKQLPLDRIGLMSHKNRLLSILQNIAPNAKNLALSSYIYHGQLLPDLFIYDLKNSRSRTGKSSKVP